MLVCLNAFLFPPNAPSQNFPDIKPSPQQTAWQDLEIGIIIHFGTNTFLDREWGDGTADPAIFNPTNLHAEQWIRSVKAAGAKYVILVAKHHDGFCLWPSELTNYSVKSSPWKAGKGDLVSEVSQAARKNGLQFGIYLSPWDRHDPRYADPPAYDKYYLGQLDELASHYGAKTVACLTRIGTSSTALAICVGAPSKQTRRCASSTGFGTLTTKPA